jgi:hypothetical protein
VKASGNPSKGVAPSLCKLIDVRSTPIPAAAICLLLTASLDAQQVIFSHRVYAAHGRTYEQLWIWSADAGALKQISHTERDHRFPTCDADGRHILFDNEESGLKTTRWRLDRVTGAKEPLNAPGISVNLARDVNASPAPTACDAGTARVSPDGTRIACAVKGVDILIADTQTLDEIARVPFGQHYSTSEPYAPWPMESLWSPDGRTLLVSNYGENGGSTTGELDYFLLDLTTRTWTRVHRYRRPLAGADAPRLCDAPGSIAVAHRWRALGVDGASNRLRSGRAQVAADHLGPVERPESGRVFALTSGERAGIDRHHAAPLASLRSNGMVRPRSHQDVVMITGEEDFIHADVHNRH